MAEKLFNPCAVIPVFNHQQKIAQVLGQLHTHGLPCIVIDDGSEPGCAAVLDGLAQQHAWIDLQRLPKNSGKGAAVCYALEYAFRQGYTHALQVDSDGQHNLADVPAFIASAQKNPSAVISGWRSYADMPRVRRNGRKLTDYLVWLNTLSTCIKDSMCGFRCYPLSATQVLFAHQRIGKRMDFDTDIIVRLYWQGVAIENIPTAVVYQDDIPSHFRMFNDNVLLVLMHTRLLLGMLLRLPRLLPRLFA